MTKDKIKERDTLKGILSRLKKEGKHIVFTNGCFDILHAGHVSYLEEARRLGDILVVAVNSDESSRKVKGANRPFVSQSDRMKILASLEAVDFVTLFNETDPASIVRELDPDIIAKGSDWKEDEVIGGEHIKRKGGKVVTIPFSKGYSTTSLIKKIKSL